jgi:hypothetical protein
MAVLKQKRQRICLNITKTININTKGAARRLMGWPTLLFRRFKRF